MRLGGTGWDILSDPRKTITWPMNCSPTLAKEYEAKEFKFTEKDKYEMPPYEDPYTYASNCYFEGVDPPERIPTPEPVIIIKKLEVDQDDQANQYNEFFDSALSKAMIRKNLNKSSLLNKHLSEKELMHLNGHKKRGRKNKHEHDIDSEDGYAIRYDDSMISLDTQARNFEREEEERLRLEEEN